jgi:archaemetzincin
MPEIMSQLKLVAIYKIMIKEPNEKVPAISSISEIRLMRLLRIIFLMAAITFIISCKQSETSTAIKNPVHKTTIKRTQITIIIQPFVDISSTDVEKVTKELKKYYKKIVIKTPIEFPRTSLNQSRTRHRADSLISYLNNRTKEGHLTIGLTSIDISTTKGKYTDWGIMGLSYCPGKSCIASSFRLKGVNKLEKLFKVAIHELGHTQGLPHCPENTCFMQDAKGRDPINEEKEFCPKCKAVLIKAGWELK